MILSPVTVLTPPIESITASSVIVAVTEIVSSEMLPSGLTGEFAAGGAAGEDCVGDAPCAYADETATNDTPASSARLIKEDMKSPASLHFAGWLALRACALAGLLIGRRYPNGGLTVCSKWNNRGQATLCFYYIIIVLNRERRLSFILNSTRLDE